MSKHSQTILAEHFGCDVQDIIDYRYHYGLTTIPMYHINDSIHAVSRTAPKYDADNAWEIVAEVSDGRKIWKMTNEN